MKLAILLAICVAVTLAAPEPKKEELKVDKVVEKREIDAVKAPSPVAEAKDDAAKDTENKKRAIEAAPADTKNAVGPTVSETEKEKRQTDAKSDAKSATGTETKEKVEADAEEEKSKRATEVKVLVDSEVELVENEPKDEEKREASDMHEIDRAMNEAMAAYDYQEHERHRREQEYYQQMQFEEERRRFEWEQQQFEMEMENQNYNRRFRRSSPFEDQVEEEEDDNEQSNKMMYLDMLDTQLNEYYRQRRDINEDPMELMGNYENFEVEYKPRHRRHNNNKHHHHNIHNEEPVENFDEGLDW